MRGHGRTIGKGIRTKLLIDLKLDRQAMAVPTKSSLDVMSSLCCVACDHVLHEVARRSGLPGTDSESHKTLWLAIY